MKKISLINDSTNQIMKIVVPSTNKKISTLIRFDKQQLGWFISFTYESFTINNLRITTSGNFLHQFRNIIPFGMACTTEEGQEPTLKDDFSYGRSSLYLLTSEEVNIYSEVLSGKVTA